MRTLIIPAAALLLSIGFSTSAASQAAIAQYQNVQAHWAKAADGHPDYAMGGAPMAEFVGDLFSINLDDDARAISRNPSVPAPTTQNRMAPDEPDASGGVLKN